MTERSHPPRSASDPSLGVGERFRANKKEVTDFFKFMKKEVKTAEKAKKAFLKQVEKCEKKELKRIASKFSLSLN